MAWSGALLSPKQGVLGAGHGQGAFHDLADGGAGLVRQPTSLETLAGATRDDLLAIRGVNLGTVEACERLLGHPLPWPTAYWTGRGLTTNLARRLCRAGIDSLEALGKLSFKDMRALGIGLANIRNCEALLGRHLEEG